MPYIGNQHNVGDHVNNFKVLDDISSYTATFNGSATSVVSTSNDTIRIPVHRFIQGQRVTYNNGGGSNIGGLTSGTAYYVSFDSSNTIKLATSLSNANSNTVINLSSVGGGTSHTLNAAFDGINTKFKVTFASGKAARFNNATQLNVAINNVIQRPNLSAASFTEGFAIEDSHKIVFKDAPTASDIFWGSIIANTIENFDLRDNEIDNFTGNGSTTEFTLSTVPANNESVIVTIDGVLQHPSDSATTRAYTLIDSIIQFSSAPALNAEIQVRHIGFAGATTNDVSGFYGRTGNVALTANDHITTGDLTSRNVNISGILTASSASFGGNVSIGGTLSYEDVTNIDSVGVITARNGIDCNGDLDVDGHTNLDNVSISGVTTMTGMLRIDSGNLQVYGTAPNIFLRDTNDNPDYRFMNSHGSIKIFDETNGVDRFVINPSGKVSVLYDLDVDGHTDLDNVSIAGVTTITGSGNALEIVGGLVRSRNTASARFVANNGSAEGYFGWSSGVLTVGQAAATLSLEATGSNHIQLKTNAAERLRIDSSGRLQIGSSILTDYNQFNGPGRLNIQNNNADGIVDFSQGIVFTDNVNNQNTWTHAGIVATGGSGFTGNLVFGTDSGPKSNSATGITEKMRITKDGKVGIGTNNPLSLLTLGKSANPTLEFKDYTNNARSQILGSAGGQLVFQTDIDNINSNSDFIFRADSTTNEIVRFKDTGEVGIGTDDPSGKLDISAANSTDMLMFKNGATNFARMGYNSVSGTPLLDVRSEGHIRFLNGTSERIRFLDNGNIHIAWNDGKFLGQLYDSDYYMGLTFGANSRTLFIDNRSNDTRADIAFRTIQAQSTPIERLRITSDGTITLNNNNLELSGPGSADATAFDDATWEKLVFAPQYSDVARGPNKIVLQNDTGSGGWFAGFGIHTNTLAIYSGGDTVFRQDSRNNNHAGNFKMIIKEDGDVGIGTDNPTDILDINSDSPSAVTNMYLRNHANFRWCST